MKEPFRIPTSGECDVHVNVWDNDEIYLSLYKEGEVNGEKNVWNYATLMKKEEAYVLYVTLKLLIEDEIKKQKEDDEFWKDWDPNVRITPETAAEYIKKKKG